MVRTGPTNNSRGQNRRAGAEEGNWTPSGIIGGTHTRMNAVSPNGLITVGTGDDGAWVRVTQSTAGY